MPGFFLKAGLGIPRSGFESQSGHLRKGLDLSELCFLICNRKISLPQIAERGRRPREKADIKHFVKQMEGEDLDARLQLHGAWSEGNTDVSYFHDGPVITSTVANEQHPFPASRLLSGEFPLFLFWGSSCTLNNLLKTCISENLLLITPTDFLRVEISNSDFPSQKRKWPAEAGSCVHRPEWLSQGAAPRIGTMAESLNPEGDLQVTEMHTEGTIDVKACHLAARPPDLFLFSGSQTPRAMALNHMEKV